MVAPAYTSRAEALPRALPQVHSDQGVIALERVLSRIPAKLVGTAGAAWPLLVSVERHDPAAARALLLLAAVTHQRADERRTAEYLLRHRDRIGTLGARRLLAAARCAVEMELRHSCRREVPTEPDDLARQADICAVSRSADPSVGETVLRFVIALTGAVPPDVETALLDATVLFMELARRHARYSAGLSLIAMRPSARPQARLVTHLRREGLSRVWSRRIARMLIGPDGSSPETALLWWVARGAELEDVPAGLRAAWLRDLRGLSGQER